jgi:hypothetical protein
VCVYTLPFVIIMHIFCRVVTVCIAMFGDVSAAHVISVLLPDSHFLLQFRVRRL